MAWRELAETLQSASKIASSPSSGKVLKVSANGTGVEWATDAGGAFQVVSGEATFSGNINLGASSARKIGDTSGDTVMIIDSSNQKIYFDIDNGRTLTVGNGNVGIGASPISNVPLFVSGKIRTSDKLELSGNNHSISTTTLTSSAGSTNLFMKIANDVGGDRGIVFSAGGSNRMIIEGGGKIGIGTITPSASLEIYKNTTTNNDKLLRIYNGSGLQWQIEGDGAMSGYLGNSITAVTELKGAWQTDLKVSGGDASSEASAGDVIFKTNNAEKMRLKGSSLGIGTTSPLAKFHIKDGTDAGIILQDSGESAGVGNARIRSEGGEIKIEGLNGSFATHKTILQANLNTGNTKLVGGQDGLSSVSVGGVIGVNNSNNSASVRLGYSSTDTTFRIMDSSDGSTKLSIANTTGNVGIGTTSPNALLSVGDSLSSTSTPSLIINDHVSYRAEFGYSESGTTQMWFNNTYANENAVMQFRMGGNNRMTIKNTGEIGIGTTLPTEKLHVAGNILLPLHASATSNKLKLTATTSAEIYATGYGDLNLVGGLSNYIRSANGTTFKSASSGGREVYIKHQSSTSSQLLSSNLSNFSIYSGTSGHFGFNTIGSSSTYNAITNVHTDNNTSGVKFNYRTGGTDTEAMEIGSDGKINIGNVGVTSGGLAQTASLRAKGVDIDELVFSGGSPRYANHVWKSNGNNVDLVGRTFGGSTITYGKMILGQNTSDLHQIFGLGGSNVGIGTETPDANTKLHVNGNLRLADNNYLVWSGGTRIIGQSSYIQMQTGSADAIRIDSSQRVGIGTSSPTEKLHVSGGDILVDNARGLRGPSGTEQIRFNTSDGVLINSGGTLRLKITPQGTLDWRPDGSNSLIYFTNNGKLGIGTTSPSQKLDVHGHVNIANSSGTGQFFFNTTTQSIILGSKTFIRNLNNTFEYGNTSGLQAHKFFTDGTQRVIINNSGNVGIGTSSPNADYSLTIQQPTGTNKDYILGVQDNGSNVAFRIDTDSGDNVALELFNGSGAEKIRFDAGGKSFVNDVFQFGETADLNKNVIHGNTQNTLTYSVFLKHTFKTFNTSSGSGAYSDILVLKGDGVAPVSAFTGSVGIGTTSPTQPLHVDGNLYLSRISANATNNILFHPGSGSSYPYIDVKTAGKFYLKTDGQIAMTINDTGGNIGIGTTSPLNKFHVVGDDNEGALGATDNNSVAVFQNNYNASDAVYATLIGGTTGYAGLHFGDKDDSDAGILRYDLYNADGGGGFQFHTEGSEKMAILANGRVGIGTASPNNTLEISDTDTRLRIVSERHNTNAGNSNHYTFFGYDSNGQKPFIISNQSDTPIVFRQGAGAERMRIHSGGNVGIGTVSPTEKLHIVGELALEETSSTSGKIRFRDTDQALLGTVGMPRTTNDIVTGSANTDMLFHLAYAGKFMWNQDNTNRMTLTSTGLGIKTTDIGYPLDVHGNMMLSGALYGFQDGSGRVYDRKFLEFAPQPCYYTGDNNHFHTFKNYGGTAIMSIGGANNRVGIGTTSPSYNLHTTGNTFTTEKFLILTNKLIQSRNSAGAGDFGNSIMMKNHSTGNMQFTLESDAYDFVFTNGKVGIGTTNPSKILHINDGTYNLQIDGNELFHSDSNPFYIKSADAIALQPSQTTRLLLDDNSRISLSNNDSGASNTIFGYTSGANIAISGDKNTLYGKSTGYSISTGDSNTNLGWEAGYYNVTGSNNTAVGSGSMMGVSGQSNSGNTAVGFDTLKLIRTGANNTAVGKSALGGITAGNMNVAVGAESLNAETVGYDNVAVGVGSGLQANGSYENVILGKFAGKPLTDGDGNVIIGFSSGNTLESGRRNTLIGKGADTSSSGALDQIVIGRGATGVGDNKAIIGGSNITDVYMGDNGSSWSTTSDGRLKENVEDWNVGLDAINKLRIVSYNFKEDNPYGYNPEKERQGIIAQEAQEVIPEMVDDKGEWLSANQEPMIWALVNAVQELTNKVNVLETKLKEKK